MKVYVVVYCWDDGPDKIFLNREDAEDYITKYAPAYRIEEHIVEEGPWVDKTFELRKSGLAKLTDAEKQALGL